MKFTKLMLLFQLSQLLFTGCSGVLGTTEYNVTNDEGVVITETHTMGVEVRNLPSSRGLTIGSRVSRYVHPQRSGVLHEPTGWGKVEMPDEIPLFTSSRTIGLDLAWESIFRGLSLGTDYRSCAMLPLDQSATLEIQSLNSQPLRAKYYHP